MRKKKYIKKKENKFALGVLTSSTGVRL